MPYHTQYMSPDHSCLPLHGPGSGGNHSRLTSPGTPLNAENWFENGAKQNSSLDARLSEDLV